jgi:hypothetical protein
MLLEIAQTAFLKASAAPGPGACNSVCTASFRPVTACGLPAAGNNGTLGYITTVFSHELVEIATDPNGRDGVRQVGCTAGSCQIGDFSQNWCDTVRGPRAQAYWSQIEGNGIGNAVLPKIYSIRRTLAGRTIGGKLPRPMPSANAWIRDQF